MDESALDTLENQVIDIYEATEDWPYCTARLWDDGVVDPRDSRRALGMMLSVCDEASRRQTHPNSFGVARL